MKELVAIGITDYSIQVFIQDSSLTTGAGKTGLTSSNITAYYSRIETDNDFTVTAISLSALSTITDAHSDGGFIAIDGTNMPGWYRLDLPDAMFASGAWVAGLMIKDAGSNNVAPVTAEFKLISFDLLTALTVAGIADGVWDEAKSGHVVAGSFGEEVQAHMLSSEAPTNFGDLAITVTTGLVSVGTNNDKTGYSISGTIQTLDALDTAQDSQHSTTQTAIATAQADLDLITGVDGATLATAQGNYAPAKAGDNMGTVSAVTGGINTGAGVITTLDGLDTAQDTQHSTTQSAISALNDLSVDDILDSASEVDGLTIRQILGTLLAAAAGQISGAATTTVTITNPAGTQTRITATVDADGNRSSITLGYTGL